MWTDESECTEKYYSNQPNFTLNLQALKLMSARYELSPI